MLIKSGDDNWDDDFLSDISPNGLQLPQLKPQDHFGGLLSSERLKALASSDNLRAFASSVDLSNRRGSESDNWDANFIIDGELDYNTIKATQAPMRLNLTKASEMSTLRPPSGKGNTKFGKATKVNEPKMVQQTPQNPRTKQYQFLNEVALPSHQASTTYRPHPMELFGNGFRDDESVFSDGTQELLRRDSFLSPKLFDPSDFGGVQRKLAPLYTFSESSPKQAVSSVKIQKYAENEGDGDYSDIVSEAGSDDGALRLIPNLQTPWPTNEDDEDDPFASLEQGFDDLEANLARDKHARMCADIKELVGCITVTQSDDTLYDVSESLVR